MTKDKILEDYLNFKKTEVFTKSKLEGYELYLKKFLNSTNKPLGSFTEKDIINFLNSLTKNYKIGSINAIKSMIHSFMYWYFQDKVFSKFPNIKRLCKAQKTEKKYKPEDMLSKKDIEKLIQEEHTSYWKAYWLLLFYGCFRPGEVCKLEWTQIEFVPEGAFIRIYVKKNKREFEKFIPSNVTYYLKKLQNNGSRYVFPTIRKHKHKIPVGDKHLTRSGVYQRLRDLSIRALGKQINPYVIRHSIGTILYTDDNLKTEYVSQQMGHSTNMRETYTNLNSSQIRKKIKKIWIQSEDLPPEKKAKLEKEVEMLRLQLERHEKLFKELTDINRDDWTPIEETIKKYKLN